jgi:hypothetical protein
MQWLNPTTGLVLFWDDEKWLQMPTTGAAGKDGVDGVDGLWTDNGDTSISYMDGNVGVGTDDPLSALDVKGKLTLSASGGIDVTGANSTTTQSFLKIYRNGDGDQTGNFCRIRTRGDGAGNAVEMIFDTNSAEAMRIDADGNVGIGTTPGSTTGLSLNRDYNLSWQEGSGTSICNAFRQTQTGSFVLAQGYKWSPTGGGFASSQGGQFGRSAVRLGGKIQFYVDSPVNVPEGADFTPTPRMIIDGNGRVDITGSLYVNGTPKIGYQELISTLATLRNATKDETTLEGLRDSIGNAIGGLIEEFENQIATMPMPEASTQEIADE